VEKEINQTNPLPASFMFRDPLKNKSSLYTVVTVSSYGSMLIGYVVSGAVLCVWAEFIMLATNRTEAVVNESRAQ